MLSVLLKFLVFLSVCVPLSVQKSGNILCYYRSSSINKSSNGKFTVDDINPNLCTHILYAFVGIDENGFVRVDNDWDESVIDRLLRFKEQNADLKILLSMGGWEEGSETLSKVAADSSLRENLVQSVVKFLDEYGFDGFDLDWEYPGFRGGIPEDRDNLVTLLSKLRIALHLENKTLSAVVLGRIDVSKVSYDVANISKNVDMLNIAAFDYHDSDLENYTGHYAPLYASHLDKTDEQKLLNLNASIKYWLDQGADPSKINLGLSTYGRGFTLAVPNNTSLYATAIGGSKASPYTNEIGVVGFNEVCEFYKDWEQTWDDDQEVPHKVNGDQWIGFDEYTSIELKIKYAHMNGLGGLCLWSLDGDDFQGRCEGSNYPILTTINLYW